MAKRLAALVSFMLTFGVLLGAAPAFASVPTTSIGVNISTGGTLTVTGDAMFDTDTLFVDSANHRVGINESSPDTELHVTGTVKATEFEGGGSGLTGLSKSQVGLGNVTNDAQLKAADLDTDATLGGASSSDTKIASQKATKQYVDDADSALSALKLDLSGGTMTGDLDLDGNALLNVGGINDVSATELGYLDGVTSSLQTQLGAKADKVTAATSGHFAGLDSSGNLVDSGFNSASFLSPTGNGSGLTSLTAANITQDSTHRFVSDSQITVIGNTSGINTGDQDLSGLVANTRTVNGHALTANVTVTKSDVSLGSVDNLQQLPMSYLDTDSSLTANSDAKVASQKATKQYVDGGLSAKLNLSGGTLSGNLILGSHDISGGGTISATAFSGSGASLTGLTKAQVGLGNVPNTDATVAANITQDSTHRFVSDTQLTAISGLSGTNTGDQDLSGYALTSSLTSGLGTKLNLTGGTMSGDLALGGHDISGGGTISATAFSGSGASLTGLTTANITDSSNKRFVTDSQLSSLSSLGSLATLSSVNNGNWSGTQLAVGNGGTGLTTTPSSGKLLIGNASSGYTLANLSQGSGITITNGDGSITIAASASGGDAMTSGTLAQFASTTSAQLKGVISDETGTGGLLVYSTSPSLTTPVLGVASATSINKVAITAPATSATLTIADGKTLAYDEGTFTPTVTMTGGSGTAPAFSASTGHYVKIGNRVFVSVNLVGTGSGATATGVVTIAVPFAISATQQTTRPICGNYVNNTTDSQLHCDLVGGASTVTLEKRTTATAVSTLVGTDLTNATHSIQLEFSYEK